MIPGTSVLIAKFVGIQFGHFANFAINQDTRKYNDSSVIQICKFVPEAAVYSGELANHHTRVVPVLVESGNDPGSLLCRASYRKTAPHFMRKHFIQPALRAQAPAI